MEPRTKVLVVDGSAVARQAAIAVLSAARDLEVLGAAPDVPAAIERMKRQWPDVLVLDVETPRVDGLAFLRKLMKEQPTRVVVSTSQSDAGAKAMMQALDVGAVTVATKPGPGARNISDDESSDLVAAVRDAARADLTRLHRAQLLSREPDPKLSATVMLPPPRAGAMIDITGTVLAVGASAGGPQALEVLLRRLPRVCPGVVIVQHLPEQYTERFAARLDDACDLEVREAKTGDRVVPGRALISPGGRHMLLRREGRHYHVDIVEGPAVNRHRPSVDVLFRSVASEAGRNAIGVILTGMGDDGARGLMEMKQAGARTLAQDEQSCVVYGMPREAVRRGAVDVVAPLDEMADRIMGLTMRRR